jgi:hypothetical protein
MFYIAVDLAAGMYGDIYWMLLVPCCTSFLFEGEVSRHAMRLERENISVPRKCEERRSPMGPAFRIVAFIEIFADVERN